MNRELKIILVKFTLITIGILAFTFIMAWVVSPYLVQQVYGQSAFDSAQNQFNQQYQDPYNNQYQQQYQQQPYMDPYQQQYGPQYGTPYQQPYYGQQPYGAQPQNPIQFGTSEIIYTILGGGAIGYARYNQTKRNQDKEIQREQMAYQLKTMEAQKELARVTYQMNQAQADKITDAPSIKLQTLENEVNEFRDKVAKT